MASGSSFSFDKYVLQERNKDDNVGKGIEPKRNFMSTGNINLLKQFIDFCRVKKINLDSEPTEALNAFRYYQEKGAVDLSSFREDLKLYFGHQLLPNVVEELCKLVQDSSHDKCSSCMLPTESLIISVLQILSDASQIGNSSKENCPLPHIIEPNVTGMHGISSLKDPATLYSQQFIMRTGQGTSNARKCTRIVNQESTRHGNNIGNSSKENCPLPHIIEPNVTGMHGNSSLKDPASHCSQQFIMFTGQGTSNAEKCTRIVNQDSTRHGNNVNRAFHEFAPSPSQICVTCNGAGMNKKLKTNAAISQSFIGRKSLFRNSNIEKESVLQDKVVAVVESVGTSSSRDVSLHLGKSNDELVSNRNFCAKEAEAAIHVPDDRAERQELSTNWSDKGIGSRERFSISDQETCMYKVICELAHSQWSCNKAVGFSMTSVTYAFLGESVKLGGKVDEFFMSVICRKFFEDLHPRHSKKHFFYPRIGGCLYSYSCSYDIRIVQKSFVGANSAYKIHKSDKLCFPVFVGKHWFVFIVDLKNKLYVFLDSYFDHSHDYQIKASSKLINAFKECWYQYAEGSVNLDDFTLFYPPAPKQETMVDCGIFAIKFMEMWDKDVDLREVFDQSDIANIRVKLAVELFFSKWNCLDKSLVLNLYRQLEASIQASILIDLHWLPMSRVFEIAVWTGC